MHQWIRGWAWSISTEEGGEINKRVCEGGDYHSYMGWGRFSEVVVVGGGRTGLSLLSIELYDPITAGRLQVPGVFVGVCVTNVACTIHHGFF